MKIIRLLFIGVLLSQMQVCFSNGKDIYRLKKDKEANQYY